jgi:hypothetical protein
LLETFHIKAELHALRQVKLIPIKYNFYVAGLSLFSQKDDNFSNELANLDYIDPDFEFVALKLVGFQYLIINEVVCDKLAHFLGYNELHHDFLEWYGQPIICD